MRSTVSEARRRYGVIDSRLGQVPYRAGEYSIADMAPYPWLRLHKCRGQTHEEFPRLSRRYAEVRPAAQRGLAALKDALQRNRDRPSGAVWVLRFGKGQFQRQQQTEDAAARPADRTEQP